MPDDWTDEADYLIDCPECGAEVYGDADRCPKCGHWITEADSLHLPGAHGEPPWWKKAFAIVAVVLIVLASLGFLVLSVGTW